MSQLSIANWLVGRGGKLHSHTEGWELHWASSFLLISCTLTPVQSHHTASNYALILPECIIPVITYATEIKASLGMDYKTRP